MKYKIAQELQLRPMSHLQFSRTICRTSFLAQQNCKCDMASRASFNSRATLFPNRALLSSLFLFCFCSLYIFMFLLNLFKLFNSEMEWSNAKMLQLIKLYEKRPYLYDFSQRACNRQSQRMQLYRATLLHTRARKLREKIAGVTSVLHLDTTQHY